MNKKNISENKKAFPKFLGIILISGLIGGVIGAITGFIGTTQLSSQIIHSVYSFLNLFVPYSIWIFTILLTGIEWMLYRQARSLFQTWNTEDETIIETAEEKLSWIVLFTSINQILGFFFFGIETVINSEYNIKSFLITAIGFVVSLIIILKVQQKTVDLIKEINPEKKGSIYDFKFKDKWIKSCDENEKRQIGQASFKAFHAVIYTCFILWVCLILFSRIFSIGLLPIFIVTIIFGVAQISYCYECIRLGKHHKSIL